MAENKTRESDADVVAFIHTVEDQGQRDDALVLTALMARLSGQPAKMWGSAIIGFGHYHYHYASGREGDWARVSFSPRKGKTVLYIMDGFVGHADIIARLGKYKTGKSCLYIKRLSDIDLDVLEALVTASLAHMDEKYPKGI